MEYTKKSTKPRLRQRQIFLESAISFMRAYEEAKIKSVTTSRYTDKVNYRMSCAA